MKRHTQTQHPASDAPRSACKHGELVRSAATSAALIELAIAESQPPVETLGTALTRIARAMATGARPLESDIAICIESLQFHDRMSQQLAHVRDLLANVVAGATGAEASGDWPALREALRSRFTSESHRMLFNLLMPDEVGRDRVEFHAGEGSVELF